MSESPNKLAFLVHLLDHAVKVVPAARYLWGVIATSAAVAFISALNGLNRLTFVAMIAALGAMFLFYIFSRFEKATDLVVKLLGYVILTVATLGFVFVILTSAWLALTCTPPVLAYLYGVSSVCYSNIPSTRAIAEPSQLPQQPTPKLDEGPIAWNLDSQFLIITGGGPAAKINSVLLQGTSTASVAIKEASAESGLTGHRQELVANVQHQGYYPVNKVDIPPGASVWLELNWEPPLSIRDFLDQWGKFHVTIVYDKGTTYEHDFDESYIRQNLQRQIPDVFGPRVTPRNDLPSLTIPDTIPAKQRAEFKPEDIPTKRGIWQDVGGKYHNDFTYSLNHLYEIQQQWREKIKATGVEDLLSQIDKSKMEFIQASRNFENLRSEYHQYPDIAASLDQQRKNNTLEAIENFSKAISALPNQPAANYDSVMRSPSAILAMELDAEANWMRELGRTANANIAELSTIEKK